MPPRPESTFGEGLGEGGRRWLTPELIKKGRFLTASDRGLSPCDHGLTV